MMPGLRRVKLPKRAVGYLHRGWAWLIGPLLVGLVAVGLAYGSEEVTRFNRWLWSGRPWLPLLLMPAAFAGLAWISRHWFPGAQGSGIPQAIAAMEGEERVVPRSLLSLRIVVGKILLTLGGLAAGASIGREGPTVQIGAGIMHAFYGRGPLQGEQQRRTLILAGGAAGIAAAFNTPLAGIMFAIEELSSHHVFKANSSTLITVVLSGLVSLSLLGNYTYFGSTSAALDWRSGALAIAVCGLIGGLAGGLFSRALIWVSSGLPGRLGIFARSRPFAWAAACGLGVALLGVATSGLVFGTGYDPTRMTLEESGALPWHFDIAKFAATLLSSVAGIPGGIFAPSLAVGAGIGDNIATLLPGLAQHSAVVLLVMAAYLAGVTRAPLMATTLIASAASKAVCPLPLYHALAGRLMPEAKPPQAP
ncbi:MAG: chloride channel protein [Burkholderia sp.]|nr:chloride channel protein [Burkholderia sp.]